jgi:hypothetical protein
MRRILILALLLAPAWPVRAAPGGAPKADAAWQITLTQLALNGRILNKPTEITCPPSGCDAPVSLLVGDTMRRFLAGFSFVQSGAYLSLQALEPGLGKVIGFTDGYEGPIFIGVRGAKGDQMLRFTLSGVADYGPKIPALMNNAQSLVFHRKMAPDLSLRVQLSRAQPKG